ncbi:MAG: HD domain-containing protein [Lentisphaerae bacterium]|nr:HD domain-containing protein [Lentisphaerota bacterium]
MMYSPEEKRFLRCQLPRLEGLVEERLRLTPACHALDHTQRVRRAAAKLAGLEGADPLLLDYAALLHDIGRAQELADQGKTCHAELGAEISRQILAELGIENAGFVDAVCDCVRQHRFRRRGQAGPQSLEAKVLYDADKLDSLGAIGLARAFHFAGRIGAKVHNSAELAMNSKSYSSEDSAYREYLVKLRRLPEKMLTENGRKMGRRRLLLMQQFFDSLNLECLGADLLD